MKKLVKAAGIAAAVLLVGAAAAVPVVNDRSAAGIEERLTRLPLPAQTEIVESVSQAGKFTGNGNGMQYFGAILIKSELSEADLELYYASLRENQWDCLVERQTGREIACIEHGKLSLQTDVPPDEAYYIVYSWGDGIKPFSELDIRGH